MSVFRLNKEFLYPLTKKESDATTDNQGKYIRTMAEEAAAFSTKQGVVYDVYAKTAPSETVSSGKTSTTPVDWGMFTYIPTTYDYKDLTYPMASTAVEFGNKKGVDNNMFVGKNAAPTKPDASTKKTPVDFGMYATTPALAIDNKELLHPMASQAAAFAKKKGADWGMYQSTVPASSTKQNVETQMPVDWGLFEIAPPSTVDEKELLHPMASLAAEFAKKKGVDWGMYVTAPAAFTAAASSSETDNVGTTPIHWGIYIPMPRNNAHVHNGKDGWSTMPAEAAEFAKKRGIDWDMFLAAVPATASDYHKHDGGKKPVDWGLFIPMPHSADTYDDLLRPMASEAADLANKKGIDFGMFVNGAFPAPIQSPMADFAATAVSSLRPKDDFPPTLGQTGQHPSLRYHLFTPEMASEFYKMVSKSATKDDASMLVAVASNNRPPSEKEQEYLVRKTNADKIAAAREQASARVSQAY